MNKLCAWLAPRQKLQEGAEVSLGPSEVESAEDFFLATSLRHRCALLLCCDCTGWLVVE